MNLSRQSGVALVQVLLISGLLLLLVVQLSLSAKNSVELAIQLKTKSQSSLNALNHFAIVEFNLLTQPKGYSLIWENGESANFSGVPIELEPGVTVVLQDLAGLLSTSFFGPEWIQYLQSDEQKLNTLKHWQGIGDYQGSSNGKRNARIPYLKEIKLLTGWENQDLQHLTSIPTGFFNLSTAPESLLYKLYPEDTVFQILQLRNNNEIERQRFNLINGLEDSSAFHRSNFVQVKIEQIGRNNVRYSRSRRYDVQPGKNVPIVEIGVGTP